MTREEHLLTIIAEECSEIAKAASKALRFGLDHIGPEADEINALLMQREFADLTAVMQMLSNENRTMAQAEASLDWMTAMVDKKRKVENFLAYSKERGRLQ